MIDVEKIRSAKTVEQILEHVMDAVHDIGGAYYARRALGQTNLTAPLRKSMEGKALTDAQIEQYSLDVWESVALRLSELKKGSG